MTGRGPEAWRASAAAAVEQRMAREQRTEPTPAERAILERIAVDQRAQQAQSAPPQQSQNAPQPPAQNAPQQQAAIASADEVISNANRHVPVTTGALADDPAVLAFSSGPTIQPPAPEIDVFVNASDPGSNSGASGQPVIVPPLPPPPNTPPVPVAPPTVPNVAPIPEEEALRSPPTVPNVAPGPTPTGSSATPPAAVSAQAASDTSRAATPTGTAAGAAAGAGSTTTAPGASSTQVGNLQLSFEPNPHNQYDRVSYVFKLCMINDLDAEKPDLLNDFLNNKIRKIIIAESGVTTGFAIGDVEITDAISANFRNRSNMTTGLRIQIIEPYSLTLPDKMFQASQALGVRNWRLAPFLLQMEFRYIKADGSLYTPSGSQKLIKVYQLLVTEFDAQLKEGGTTYDVQAGVKGNLGFRDAYQIVPQTHRVEVRSGNPDREFGIQLGDNKVGTFFATLGRDITTMYVTLRRENVAGHKLPVMIYKFIVEPALADQEINFVQAANSRRNSFRTSEGNNGVILVSRGISVSALVDDILASLKNPEFFMQNMDQGGLIKIPTIECVTRNVGWDLLTNDYVREFTFFIRLKDSNRPVPTSQYGQAVQSDTNLQQSRMQAVSKNLKKRYDYFYTGLNTEIINCEIKFNQMHIIPQALFQVTTPMTYASANRVSPNDPNLTGLSPTSIASSVEEQTRLRSQALASLNGILQDANAGDDPNASATARQADSARRAAEERLKNILKETVIPFEPDTPVAGLLESVTNRGQEAATIREGINQTQRANAARASTREFAEDINMPIQNNMLELSYYADPRDVLNSFARPTVIEAGGGNEQSGGNNVPGGTRPMVSSMLSQIYDRSGQHLLEVDLEIRGDPYWLGVTDLERTQELLGFMETIRTGGALPERLGVPTAGTAGTTSFSRQGLVDKHDQDANILLKFRAGAPPKQSTGFMDLNEGSTFFYGVYTVIECLHEFKSGKFTQKLKANRDLLINVEQLRAAERTAVNATQPRQVQAVTPGAPNAEQAATNPSNAQLTNPNASPANLTRSTQAAEVGGGSGQTPLASNGYISGNSPEAIAARRAELAPLRAENLNEEFAGGRGRAPQGNVADLIGSTSRTGEGGLRDPANSILGPRQRLSASEIESLGVRQSVIDEVTARNRAAAGR